LLALDLDPERTASFDLAIFQENFRDTAIASVFITSKKNTLAPFAKAEFYDNLAEIEAYDETLGLSVRFINTRTNDEIYLPLYNDSTSWEPTLFRPAPPDVAQTTLLLEVSDVVETNLRVYLSQFHPEVDFFVLRDDQINTSQILDAICLGRVGGTVLIQGGASRFVLNLCHYLKVFGYRVHLFRGFSSSEVETSDSSSPVWMGEQGIQTQALQRLVRAEMS
jgi:hypothetical protein